MSAKGNRQSLQDIFALSDERRKSFKSMISPPGGSRPLTPAFAAATAAGKQRTKSTSGESDTGDVIGPLTVKIFGSQISQQRPSSSGSKTHAPLVVPPLVGLNMIEIARDERDLQYLKDYGVFPLLNEAALRTMHTNADGPKNCDVLAAISGACDKVQFERSPCCGEWLRLQKDLGATATGFVETVVDGYSKFHDLPTIYIRSEPSFVQPGEKKEGDQPPQQESPHLQFVSRIIQPLELETESFEKRHESLLKKTPQLIVKALQNPKPYLISTTSKHSQSSNDSGNSRVPSECLGMAFEFSSHQISDTLVNRRAILDVCSRMSFLRNDISRVPWRLAMGQAHQLKARVDLDESKDTTNWIEEIRGRTTNGADHKARKGYELDPSVSTALVKMDEEAVAQWITRQQEDKYKLTDGVTVLRATLVALETMKQLPALGRHSVGRLGMYATWTKLLVLYQRYLPLLAHLLHCNQHWKVLLKLPDEKFEHRLQLAITNCKVDDRSLYEVTLLLHDRQECVDAIECCMKQREEARASEFEVPQQEVDGTNTKKAPSGKGDDAADGKKKKSKAQ